jgi:two-component system, response regulator YesN
VYVYRVTLETEGLQISTFTDPIEAFDKLKNHLEDYALVISDYRMPKMNGNILCTKLINLNPDLKIILISAYDDIEYDASRFDFIRKPISTDQLLKMVKKKVNKFKSINRLIYSGYIFWLLT